MDLSIIIPVYNSEKTIIELINELEAQINNIYTYEIIFIDDYSMDNSYEVLKNEAKLNKKIKVIKLIKNYGQQNAIYAGLNFVKGKYIITMDDDLQHCSDYIVKMIEKINEGNDLIYGVSESNSKMSYKNLGAFSRDLFFKINFPNVDYHKVSSFRVFRSSLVERILENNYKFIYLSAILLEITDKIDYIDVCKRKRIHGKSNYNFIKLMKLFLRLNFYYSHFISEKIKPRGNQYRIEKKINL